MVWVRSEYAGELAVISTWIAALLPWSVSVVPVQLDQVEATVVNIRFVFVQFHYVFGLSFSEQSWVDIVQVVYEIPGFVPADQRLAGLVWLGTAVLFAGVVLLSFVYYARDERLEEAAPVDPVRAFGVLIGLTALALSAATVLFQQRQPITVPVGVLFMWAFAYLLLRVDRT